MRMPLAASFMRILVIAFLLLAIYFSAKWMLADFYGERVALSLSGWQGQALENLTSEILDEHLEFIQQARKGLPASARYMEIEARIRLLRSSYLESGQIKSELVAITDLHRQALELRPYWPFSWANLAYMKSLQFEYDEEFDLALAKSIDYGPSESSVLRLVSYAGISGWNQLSPASRNVAAFAIYNAAEQDRRLARDLRGRLEQAELHIKFCQQADFHSQTGYDRICG